MTKGDNTRSDRSVNSNNHLVPTYFDKEGSRLALLLGCGSLGPTVYLVLCHLEAGRKAGWSGSIKQLRDAICAYGGSKPQWNTTRKVLEKIASAGLLVMEPGPGQQTVFKLAPPPDTPEAEDESTHLDVIHAFEAAGCSSKKTVFRDQDVWLYFEGDTSRNRQQQTDDKARPVGSLWLQTRTDKISFEMSRFGGITELSLEIPWVVVDFINVCVKRGVIIANDGWEALRRYNIIPPAVRKIQTDDH